MGVGGFCGRRIGIEARGSRGTRGTSGSRGTRRTRRGRLEIRR